MARRGGGPGIFSRFVWPLVGVLLTAYVFFTYVLPRI